MSCFQVFLIRGGLIETGRMASKSQYLLTTGLNYGTPSYVTASQKLFKATKRNKMNRSKIYFSVDFISFALNTFYWLFFFCLYSSHMPCLQQQSHYGRSVQALRLRYGLSDNYVQVSIKMQIKRSRAIGNSSVGLMRRNTVNEELIYQGGCVCLSEVICHLLLIQPNHVQSGIGHGPLTTDHFHTTSHSL